MDEVVLGGDINGKADSGRKKDPSSSTVTAHRMTAQFVLQLFVSWCTCMGLCGCVICLCVQVDERRKSRTAFSICVYHQYHGSRHS